MKKQVYSNGEEVILNAREKHLADMNQTKMNALGYEVNITTLTTISKRISEQKFFEVAPADYMPVKVGEGAWSSNITTYLSYSTGGNFDTGILNTGVDGSRMAAADAAVDSLNIKILNWAKRLEYTIFDLEMASKSGNWDLVSAKERSRKKNWDLGVQKVAFLGLPSNTNVLGLLNQSTVTNNTTLITEPISTMTTAELKVFLAGLVDAFRSNCNRTAWPTHFILPESDYLGLAAPASGDFPIRSTLSLLEETLQIMCKNKNFKILPLAYGDPAYNSLGVHRYVMLNYDEESIVMNIPVDYTNTLANSFDNFSFQNVGYGQFTGVLALRPQEVLYFSY